MNCLNCGKEIEDSKKYCNNKCQKDFQYKNYIKNWKNGLETGMRGKYQVSEYVPRYLIEKSNNKCSKCGWGEKNPYTNLIPLEIDHKDGNYLNNKEDNLELLCPNCHSLTSTWKGANKNKGREDRKKIFSL